MVVRRRPLLRAAVVGGTYAAGRSSGQKAEQRADAEATQDERISTVEASQVPAQPTAEQLQSGPSGGGTPMLDQLSQLTAMHDQGALSDDEFAAAKAKILGG